MTQNETKLIIFKDKSVLEKADGKSEVFEEGASSENAEKRSKLVKEALTSGFLRDIIGEELQSPCVDFEIDETQAELIKNLVDSVTSEVGRALIGITVMQLCIKAIVPEQSIRLHKGGKATGSNFSWKEGISMRTLDKSYITPVLREFDLLRLNADGFMMTRSLAENYPYTELYKAAIRGAKPEWIDIVDALEGGKLYPLGALKYLISLLINRSNKFLELADKCLKDIDSYLEKKNPSPDEIKNLIGNFFTSSEYSARAFEVSVFSAYTVLDEMGYMDGFLKPLSQMRSANKKHGNIGDVEILESSKGMAIIESWDAKLGKSNLREELEELSEKLFLHPECRLAGFITDIEPQKNDEIVKRSIEIKELHDCEIEIKSYEDWCIGIKDIVGDELEQFSYNWIRNLAECLCQKKRDVAPIDEPCEHWIQKLIQSIRGS